MSIYRIIYSSGRTGVCWSTNNLAIWCEELTHWKGKPRCWERLKEVGEGDDRAWDSWLATPTRGHEFLATPGSWWCTGKPGMLQSIWSQRVRHNSATELNWTQVVPLIPWKWLQNYYLKSKLNQVVPCYLTTVQLSVTDRLHSTLAFHLHCLSFVSSLLPISPLPVNNQEHQAFWVTLFIFPSAMEAFLPLFLMFFIHGIPSSL